MQTIDLKGAYLSPQQTHLWHWLQEKQQLRVQGAFEITGELKPGMLEQALQQVVDRHEILHTTFTHVPGMELPMQVLGKHIEISCPVIDLGHLSIEVQQGSQEGYWHELLQRPFNLEHGPLLHALVLHLSSHSHVLILSLHALCADASTLRLVGSAILQAYSVSLHDGGEVEEEDPLQYVNVTAWLNELLQDEAEEQFAYWHKVDLSHLNSIRLPFEGSKEGVYSTENRSAQTLFEQRQITIPLPLTVQQRLKIVSQEREVSVEAVLLAVWQILLWRLTDNPDVLVGMLYDGRPYEELTDLLGPYACTVPIGLSLTESSSFAWVLRQVQHLCQQSREKQLYFTRESIVANEHERPYFPINFAYEVWSDPVPYDPLTISLLRQEYCLEPSQLQLHVWQSGNVLRMQFMYDVSVFSEGQVRHIATMFVQLLNAAIDQPEVPISSLSLLTQVQQIEQEERLRGPERAWPFVPLHRLFEEQVRRQPNAAALRCGPVLLSYEQLEHQANQLAHILLQQGLLPGAQVALCLPRDHWTIVGLLAVLKAGGVYVPLDMQMPTVRLHSLLNQLAPDLMLSSQLLQDQLPSLNVPVVCVEELSHQLTNEPCIPPQIEVGPEDLVYVMYTSGSTGVPKGVQIRQRSVSNYTQAMCELLELQAGWHFATVSSLAADLGNTSIFCGLASGGCVHILSYEQITDATAFSVYVEQYPLDVLKIVPTHLQTLLMAGTTGIVPRERLILGGEALSWSLVEQLQQLAPSCQLYNHYGPTEATIGTLVQPLGPIHQIRIPASERRGASVPIGHPLANTQAYLLDERRQWVPNGVVGELYLAGAGLAAGYQPASTQGGFLELDLAGKRQRLYKTGDWVREREPGVLEFVGRRDEQVKLRGYRIELGEIEAALRQHPQVWDCVVLLQEKGPAGPRLIGYVVARTTSGLTSEVLGETLKQSLPAYMVPSTFVLLETLPLTSNGKVDRRQLPQPEQVQMRESVMLATPRSPLEDALLAMWQDLLALSVLGIHDNFFAVGGHSLLAMRLIAQIRAVLQVELPVKAVFDAPTVAALAQRIEQVLHEDEVLAQPPLVARARPEEVPLSYAQQRLWFLDQLEPGSTTYLVPSALNVRGAVDVQHLEQALQGLIRRHESLRTTFEERSGQPVQIVHHARPYILPVIDLQPLGREQREREAQRLAGQEAGHPCDLVQGPLLRVHLLRLESQEHVLLVTLHHIITDGWSNGVFVHELMILYRSQGAGQPSLLAPLPIQYADYALWQREWLRDGVLEAHLAYWRTQLAQVPPLEMPTDHPHPAIQSFRGAVQSFLLPAALSEGLVRLSQQEHVTLFMTLLAAFQVLLQRYSGQDDFGVGTPIANRGHAEIEGLIGFFVNTLVLRTDLYGNPTFTQVLQQVREVCLGAYAHQDVPFEQVVETLAPTRDLSRSPLFQVMLVLQNTPQEHEQDDLAGMLVESLLVESTISKFDLTLSLSETANGLAGTLEYNRDLFEAETIMRLLGHWQILLEGIVHHPQVCLSELPLLTAEEHELQFVHWNATATWYPQDLCIHQLFEQQVQRTPEVVALVFEDETLTYACLDRRANQLAHYLQMLGVGPEVLVGLCLERSIEMVVAVLGILKAGGAYVPLDPSYPQERFAFVVHDADLPLLLTHKEVRARLPIVSCTVVCLEDVGEAIADAPDTPLEQRGHPAHLAYILYTSGSTGQPKGVMVPHTGVVNYLHWARQTYIGSEGYGAPLHSSLSFDLTVTSLFVPLLTGQQVVLLSEDQGVTALATALCNQKSFTLSKVTPSHLDALSSFLSAEPFAEGTQVLILGGEALWHESLLLWQQAAPGTRIFNEYGPTETVVGCCIYEVLPEPSSSGAVPIGKPIANMQAYVLTRHLQPVPSGVSAELYMGGVGVTRGYLNRPDLTAERFIPDPFSTQGGTRLYRTGDLVRSLPDGTLDYIGRVDQQVKIRGYRIELGEIEAILRGHPAIQDTVVLAREDVPGDKRLVAYVVLQPGQTLTMGELRSCLHNRLPAYMLPAHMVLLDTLPLTSNGKVDRKGLPAPDEWEEDEGQQRARTPIEEVVQGLWSTVLGRSQIGIDDNFFELGGHSLLATQLLARVRATLGVEIPLRALFEEPTVAGFARRVEQILRQDDIVSMPLLVARERPEEVPLSYAQQRLWFLEQLEPGNTAYLVPNALNIHGVLETQHLQGALHELIDRHESLRTTFEERAGQPVQVIHPTRPYTLPVIDLHLLGHEQREREAYRLASQEAQNPCDLVCGPLLRTSLLRLEKQEHVLLLTLHHIITDGWSNGVLVQELMTLYRSFVAGQPSPLEALPLQYADYVLWQRGWLQGEVLEAHLAYWRAHLAQVPLLEMPTDHPRPPVQAFRGAIQLLQLSAPMSKALEALSQQEHVTLFMTLLAAFQVLLQRYSGQDDFGVGTPIANRGHAEIEGLIGFFVNTLVLRTDLSGNPTFTQVLQRVREVCLGAYAHQDVPFEQVVEALAPTRDLSRSPLFQVMLVLQNIPQAHEPDDLAGIRVESLAVESTVSKFDLTLSLSETENGLGGTLEYNTDLFEAPTITRLLGHWQTLLEGIVQNPQAHLSDLPLLTAEEQELQMEHWNATRREYPQDRCVHQLFEDQVQRTPEAVALLFEDETLTYACLNRRANQLAHHLQTLGVGPDILVGIGLERSIEMVLALLAVLKAGGGYVPLDPQYPEDRLAFIIADAQLHLLLTQQRFQALFASTATQQVWLDVESEVLTDLSDDPVESCVGMDQLAYVLYTSGSTGRPKGVMISHRALSNHMRWMHDAFPLLPQERLLQKTSFSFDASVWEVYAPLLCGASLILATPEGPRDSRYLIQVLQEQAITRLQLVPSQLRILLEEPDFAHGPILQHVFCGGEALSTDLATRFFAAGSGHLHNLYGPTETTIDAICWQCHPEETGVWPPIGRPIANVHAYILDTACRPVPVGVVGELYLAGVGLARGYLGRPDLTAEKFLPHPFAHEGGSRLYKTGDQARYRADGVIEYLGRIDNQVKIRGYRIELGEIEAALRELPVVQDAAVLAREDVPGEKRLVAYVVLHAEHTLTMSTLRTSLQDRLPVYMLPAHLVVLDTLPLTSNGKLDRKALPAPMWERSHDTPTFLAPHSAIEKTLATIWEEVLHTKDIGIQDNFFERGGDSIISIQIIARARQQGLRFTLKQLFQYQTIEQLSPVVDTAALVQAEQGLVLGSSPLTPIQHWFFEQDPVQPQHWNQALFLEMAERLQGSLLEQVVRAWLSQHDALRLRFHSHADGWSQSLAPLEDSIPCVQIDLSRLRADDHECEATYLAGQTQASLDLSEGPLVRVVLFERGPDQAQLLLLVIHHLAVDGVSWRILLEDLSQAYQHVTRGEKIVLPAKTSSFKAWAEHLQTYAHSAEMQQELTFWLNQIGESVRALPRDLDGQENTVASALGISSALTVEETRALLEEVPAIYHTQINEVLLTALAQVLSAWMGSRGVLLDLEGHGREDLFVDLDLSRTVGWFTSIFPVYLTVEETSHGAQAIQRVKEHLRAIPNHGVGYGILRSLSRDPVLVEQLRAQPQAEVSFNYLGQLDQVGASPGVSSLLVGASRLSAGLAQSGQGRRAYLLDIVCQVSGNQFQATWSYGEGIHRRSTIEHLASAFMEALRAIIQQSQASDMGDYSPLDFPNVELSSEQIEQIMKELDFMEEIADE